MLVTIDGEQQRIELGSRVTGGYVDRSRVSARVYQDRHGMYFTLGSINGFPVHMLLDTGATFVALNAPTARRLGVEYRNGSREIVHTAAGQAHAYGVRLNSVSVGEITMNNVEAFVLEGAGPDVPLLGMSFLRKLRVSTDNGVMLLEHER